MSEWTPRSGDNWKAAVWIPGYGKSQGLAATVAYRYLNEQKPPVLGIEYQAQAEVGRMAATAARRFAVGTRFE